jgi:starvation-inducible DNA-binding protein
VIEVRTGFTDAQRLELADGVRRVLANTYALYAKTHGYHWNVTGPNFAQLHELFSQQYTEMWGALDDLAERIRALGEFAPQGFAAVANLSSISGGDPEAGAEAMVEDLLHGQEEVIASLRAGLKPAERADDQVTMSLLSDRLAAHEKQAWMLRATLGSR